MSGRDQDTPWYVTAFDRSYLERYGHRDDAEAERQVGFLRRAGLLQPGSRVLDLCCGAGRHSARISPLSAMAFGMDLSPDLLLVARDALLAAAGKAPLVRGDMRHLPYRDGSFDAVIQMFTAFGYFQEDAQNRLVLKEVARVLRPGGGFVLDLLNRTRAVRTLVPRSRETRPDGTLVLQERRFDASSGRIEKRITEFKDGAETLHRFETVRVFDLDEIRSWLSAARLEITRAHGEFEEGPFDPDNSERLVILATRDVT
ncbi:MAG: class I SAM-dependent methyltransferase [Planctomycetota bacterium]